MQANQTPSYAKPLTNLHWLPNGYILKAALLPFVKGVKRTYAVDSSHQLFPRVPASHHNDDLKVIDNENLNTSKPKTRGKTIPLLPQNITTDPNADALDPIVAFGWNDPLLSRQWHLYNKRTPGHDVNVVPVWKQGITGKGVVVCIIDDGVDYSHKDLAGKFRKDLSFDFNDHENIPLPDPRLDDRHGTRCAGQIVAQPNNGICGVGVAWGAQVSAIRILSGKISTVDEAAAVVHRNDENMIYSCSWGPADDGQSIDGPAPLVLRAFVEGLEHGRNGRGSLYVFAAGNGKAADDCNYDGYANGIFSLTIGAIDSTDEMPIYMEPCAAQLAVTYSSSVDRKIATTDLGSSKCTTRHGGTSAAAPLAAGIFALVLEARPELTWRDVQHLVVNTAVIVNPEDASWRPTGAGKKFSLKYGYGKLDALRLVEEARRWKLVNKPIIRNLPTKRVNLQIPLGKRNGVSDHADITERVFSISKLGDVKTLEHITVTVFILHPSRGNLQLFLSSPSGMTHQLATRRPNDQSNEGLLGWTFMSTAFWGEPQLKGIWTLTVIDTVGNYGEYLDGEERAQLVEWRLTFWGEAYSHVNESASQYSDAFVTNYYPPDTEHFEDIYNLWNQSGMINIDNFTNKHQLPLLATARLMHSSRFMGGKMVWIGLSAVLLGVILMIGRKPIRYAFVRLCCSGRYTVLRQSQSI